MEGTYLAMEGTCLAMEGTCLAIAMEGTYLAMGGTYLARQPPTMLLQIPAPVQCYCAPRVQPARTRPVAAGRIGPFWAPFADSPANRQARRQPAGGQIVRPPECSRPAERLCGCCLLAQRVHALHLALRGACDALMWHCTGASSQWWPIRLTRALAMPSAFLVVSAFSLKGVVPIALLVLSVLAANPTKSPLHAVVPSRTGVVLLRVVALNGVLVGGVLVAAAPRGRLGHRGVPPSPPSSSSMC